MTDLDSVPGPAVCIAATFTAEPMKPALRFVLDEVELSLEIEFAPYNQVFQQLLSPTSLLATNRQGVNVALVRVEDFVRDAEDVQTARGSIQRTTRELLDALLQHASRSQAPMILGVLAPSPVAPRELLRDLESAADALSADAGAIRGIHLLTAAEIDSVSSGERYDALRDELAHVPFTEEFYASLALAVARKIHALRVPTHKVLVLDCDNTLWHGVVGEDGVDGIVIPRGSLDLQRYALSQQARGTLLCIASKNAEQDVLDVFQHRSDMLLKPEHLVAHRINWKSKPENLSSLSQELNLGLDSFVFIDDNPIECAQVKAALPQVVTLELPVDSKVADFLAHLWVFDRISVTVEDTLRTRMYRENAARQALESSTTDIADFIASLGIVIDIAPPADEEWPRVAQLTQRTNQFNFTTVRRTELEMRTCVDTGSLVLRVNVKDRFGDYGLVGVVVAQPRDTALFVDTLLLSCRVLGRGVEHAMLRHLGELATARGLSRVDLPYIRTAKNEPALAFADSAAAAYKAANDNVVLYRIPADFACSIAHRPGHDPDAVIRARKSDEKKSPAAASGVSVANRSERYSRLASEYTSGAAIVAAVRARSLHARNLGTKIEEPATDAERKLAALWQELLTVDRLGVEDDYFALGGTSLTAAQLFADIAHRFGVKLPLTTILDYPTVRALARRIESTNPAQSDVLIELKPGGPRSLFLIHDGDGETLLYRNLARRLPPELSVYGIEPRRLSRVPLAHTRIEDMARFYIEEMRRKQPKGPYMLGGLCAGGVIAYEMASQLKHAGESVKLVALFDAAKPGARKRTGQISKQRVRRLEAVFAGIRGEHGILMPRLYASIKEAGVKLKNAMAWEVSSRAQRLTTRLRFRLLHGLLARGRQWPSSLPQLSVRDIYDSAEARYVPKALSDAGVVLLRAQSGLDFDQPYREVYADDTFDWITVAKDLTVIDVKGGHSSMLQEPFVESLAKALIPRLMNSPPRNNGQKLVNDFTNPVSVRRGAERSTP